MFKENKIEEFILISLLPKSNSSQKDRLKDLITQISHWDKLIKISRLQGIAFLLYYNLDKLQILSHLPQSIVSYLKETYLNNFIKNVYLWKEFIEFLDLANQNKIKLVPFKGIALFESIYPDPGMRSFSDIDILVKEKDIPQLKNLILKRGYREKKQRDGFLFIKSLPKNIDSILEFHTTFVPARPYKVCIPNLWERLKEKNLYGKTITLLSYEDTFLSLVFHLRRHTRILILKLIYDIAKFLSLYENNLDWDYIYNLAKINHIKNAVYFSLYISKELLGVSVSLEIISKFKPCYVVERLMYRCVNRNNFFKRDFFRGYFLRLLLFDRWLDIFFYLYRLINKLCA